GRYAYVGACTVITQDVPPFSRVVTERETRCYGVNTVGLERRGFDRERLETIEKAFRLLLRSKLNTSQALEQIRAQLNGSPDIRELVEFIESAERGLHHGGLPLPCPLPPFRIPPFDGGSSPATDNFHFWCSKRRAARGSKWR